MLSVRLYLVISCQNYPKSSLQIDLANELKWTHICHWFVMFFSTWVIWWLLKCLESFVRPQSTTFGLWKASAPPYPSWVCQTCLSRLPKNHPLPAPATIGTFLVLKALWALWWVFNHSNIIRSMQHNLLGFKMSSVTAILLVYFIPNVYLK